MDDPHYYLDEDGTTVRGPLSLEHIRWLRKDGKIAAPTQICREGTEIWTPLEEATEPAPAPTSASGGYKAAAAIGILILALSLIFVVTKSKEVTGEIFVVTRGGTNYKLGAVKVRLFAKDELVPNIIATRRSIYRDMEDYTTGDSTILDHFFKAFPSKTVDESETNSDGKFVLHAPKGSACLLVAKASRSISEETENYYWVVGVPPSGSISLSNGNMAARSTMTSLAIAGE